MDLDPDAPAADLLAAELVALPPAGWWAAVRLFVAATIRAVFDDGSPARSPHVFGLLVIRRRDTGATLLRSEELLRPAGADFADGELLAYVQSQLEELTVGEFFHRWGIDPDAAGRMPDVGPFGDPV